MPVLQGEKYFANLWLALPKSWLKFAKQKRRKGRQLRGGAGGLLQRRGAEIVEQAHAALLRHRLPVGAAPCQDQGRLDG